MDFSHDELLALADRLADQRSTLRDRDHAATALRLLVGTAKVLQESLVTAQAEREYARMELARVVREHAARVTELLEANNREVARRREAEALAEGAKRAQEALVAHLRARESKPAAQPARSMAVDDSGVAVTAVVAGVIIP